MAGHGMDMEVTSRPSLDTELVGSSALVENADSDLDVIKVPALIELINQTGKALALLDPHSDRIVWCSSAWEAVLPELTGQESWSDSLSNWQELAQLYHNFEEHGPCSAVLWCESAKQSKELGFTQLESGVISLQLQEHLRTTDDMHLYMQARESMFTTSRTISVSEMATTLAHEIKQPIATITNILKGVRIRLQRSDSQPEQLEKALDNALEQAQFTNSVINRIRDFTQARRPQQKIIDIANLTQESLSLMDWLLSANQCRTELIISDEPLLCQGDPTMLQQVLVNLLRNGVEAMQECDPAHRLLTIECKRSGGSSRVSIRDRGHGLEGKETTLFVPFSTTKASGMGVGLNICRSFVELHQGRLWLSPNSGGGCTSNVELPFKDAAESSEQAQVKDSGSEQ
ncbi:MAG: sensor histidine kinase [Granulosicoccus sp.]